MAGATNPRQHCSIAAFHDRTKTQTEKDISNFETWHQRLAHCSEKRLRQTQKLVDGIPAFYGPKIPDVVTCRTCDVAKLRKAPRGRTIEDSDILVNGQVFQMDIGFIRGPENLDSVLSRTEDATTKVIESRGGYVCYLLIVDRKSRYMWPFPLKSKSIPIDLLRTFLTTHGHPTSPNKRIRTDGEGSFAESQACRNMVTTLGFTIRKTATDSSSQNGVAERPHQTLTAMVRCLLYSSSLPVTFWADAVVYAAYINYRLYHSGVQDVPYTLWTGRRADLKHLRTFGAHVSVRRSGARHTKTDPHYFDGQFLRFSATTKNIVYFDTTTKRDKTARHCVMDEFHYGTPHAQRPEGAQALLDRLLRTHTPPIDKPADPDPIADEPPFPEFVDTSLRIPPLALDSVTDTTEHNITANAAQIWTELVHTDAPDVDDHSLPDLIDTRITNPQLAPEDQSGPDRDIHRSMTDTERRLLANVSNLLQPREVSASSRSDQAGIPHWDMPATNPQLATHNIREMPPSPSSLPDTDNPQVFS